MNKIKFNNVQELFDCLILSENKSYISATELINKYKADNPISTLKIFIQLQKYGFDNETALNIINNI